MDSQTLVENNRRRFTRINFDAQCTLSSAENQWEVVLVDICLQGALVESHHSIPLNLGEQVELKIILEGGQIMMPARINHQVGRRLGFEAMNMNLDDVCHLRRLVELNLGDPALLERELAHLYST